jgi:hypothetical protein
MMVTAGLAAAGLIAAAAAYLHYTPLAIQATSQQEDSCAPMQPAGPSSSRWENDALKLRVEVKANCAATGTDFAVQRLGAALLVRSSTPVPAIATGCWCSRGYTLELRDLPRQEYGTLVYAWP